MSVYIRGMKMPTTSGLFLVGVDSSCGKDETVITVRRMLGSRDMCLDVGAYNIIPVPDHGDLIDRKTALDSLMNGMVMTGYQSRAMDCLNEIYVPTIIPADLEWRMKNCCCCDTKEDSNEN